MSPTSLNSTNLQSAIIRRLVDVNAEKARIAKFSFAIPAQLKPHLSVDSVALYLGAHEDIRAIDSAVNQLPYKQLTRTSKKASPEDGFNIRSFDLNGTEVFVGYSQISTDGSTDDTVFRSLLCYTLLLDKSNPNWVQSLSNTFTKSHEPSQEMLRKLAESYKSQFGKLAPLVVDNKFRIYTAMAPTLPKRLVNYKDSDAKPYKLKNDAVFNYCVSLDK